MFSYITMRVLETILMSHIKKKKFQDFDTFCSLKGRMDEGGGGLGVHLYMQIKKWLY